ncbi:MAG: hypothetical protein KatS3mg022_3021 [Armatimonadota bacterium]|nr:MAG: hypothetical protein KatS3mg022_3021 [Armatimonadota bacterium]
MPPLVQGILLGGLATVMVLGALPHVTSPNTSTPNEKRVSPVVSAQTAKAIPSDTLSQKSVVLQHISALPVINQYHLQIIEPPPGWQGYIPCARPSASFRADMPVLQPGGILGTNRTMTPPARIMVRPR